MTNCKIHTIPFLKFLHLFCSYFCWSHICRTKGIQNDKNSQLSYGRRWHSPTLENFKFFSFSKMNFSVFPPFSLWLCASASLGMQLDMFSVLNNLCLARCTFPPHHSSAQQTVLVSFTVCSLMIST